MEFLRQDHCEWRRRDLVRGGDDGNLWSGRREGGRLEGWCLEGRLQQDHTERGGGELPQEESHCSITEAGILSLSMFSHHKDISSPLPRFPPYFSFPFLYTSFSHLALLCLPSLPAFLSRSCLTLSSFIHPPFHFCRRIRPSSRPIFHQSLSQKS